MDIREEKIDYIKKSPIGIKIYNVKHSSAHFHPNTLELVYCLKGKVSIVSGHQQLVLSTGEIFSIDCKNIHCIYSDHDNILISLYIDLTKLKYNWDCLKYKYFTCESYSCYDYQETPIFEIQDYLLSIAFLYSSTQDIDKEKYYKIANKIIDILLSYFEWFNYYDIYYSTNKLFKERFHRISAYCKLYE